MVILEKPYVSEFLKSTLLELDCTVLDNESARECFVGSGRLLMAEEEAVRSYQQSPKQPVYSNSENAIDWIDNHLDGAGLPEKIRQFKDKAAFRDLVQDLYPDFDYRTVAFEELDQVDVDSLPMPCVVKPCVGFFSLGVHMVESWEGWSEAVSAIRNEVEHIGAMYPEKVLELDSFIIEACVEGEEFAVDAYYDENGKPVIINILGHLFASSDDVSDRCYITSTEIVRTHHDDFHALLLAIGQRAALRNFPIHIEVRKDALGRVGVIEVNPMRFAGWCVTDLAYYAYGINPYRCFLKGERPDWEEIEQRCDGKVYSMVLGDIDSSVDRGRIQSVDYDAFLSRFSKPLELRKIDFKKHPVFAFAFVEVDANQLGELEQVLHADFSIFFEMK